VDRSCTTGSGSGTASLEIFTFKSELSAFTANSAGNFVEAMQVQPASIISPFVFCAAKFPDRREMGIGRELESLPKTDFKTGRVKEVPMGFDEFLRTFSMVPQKITAEVGWLFVSEQGRGFFDCFERVQQMRGITHAEMKNPTVQPPAEQKGEVSFQMPQADPERLSQTAAGIIRAAREKFPGGHLMPRACHNGFHQCLFSVSLPA
jgi:hypothetical protein